MEGLGALGRPYLLSESKISVAAFSNWKIRVASRAEINLSHIHNLITTLTQEIFILNQIPYNTHPFTRYLSELTQHKQPLNPLEVFASVEKFFTRPYTQVSSQRILFVFGIISQKRINHASLETTYILRRYIISLGRCLSKIQAIITQNLYY